jgi:hypothetical protein
MSIRHHSAFIDYFEKNTDTHNVVAFLADNPFPRDILLGLEDKFKVQFCQSDDKDLELYGYDAIGYLFAKANEFGPHPASHDVTKAVLLQFYYGSEGGEFSIYVLVYR